MFPNICIQIAPITATKNPTDDTKLYENYLKITSHSHTTIMLKKKNREDLFLFQLFMK